MCCVEGSSVTGMNKSIGRIYIPSVFISEKPTLITVDLIFTKRHLLFVPLLPIHCNRILLRSTLMRRLLSVINIRYNGKKTVGEQSGAPKTPS